jgi:acetolactate synthase-1/2/3 large subunit
MFGVFGSRSGNFLVQNADVIFSLGCRLSFKQIGFNYENFSPWSKKIVVDVDANELQKHTIDIDIPVCADLEEFLNEEELNGRIFESVEPEWIEYAGMLKKQFPVYTDKYDVGEKVNPYTLANEIKKQSCENQIEVVGNSVACVCVLQSGIAKEGQRLFGNVNCGTMGYDIPAAVGACVASGESVLCITGDGSMQMNIQELQTIVHNQLPVKLIIFNNGGYQAIEQTQTNFFGRLSGCTEKSGISMPIIEKIANAYGFPYIRIEKNAEVRAGIMKLLSMEGFAICELIQDKAQGIEPRTKSMEKEDGTLFSPPIDHLFPFLEEGEYQACQYETFKKGLHS